MSGGSTGESEQWLLLMGDSNEWFHLWESEKVAFIGRHLM